VFQRVREDRNETRIVGWLPGEVGSVLLAGQKGSLVGPRPPLVVEYERYEDWEKGRLEMRPGLTGLWQVRGRSDIDFDEMVLMDLYYIENWSLRLDFQILLRTIPAVLASRGAY